MPAKQASGRLSSANQIGGFRPSGSASFSEKLVNGTTQRLSGPSQRRQCGEAVFRTFVTPGSLWRPFRAKTGDAPARRRQLPSVHGVPHDRSSIVRKDARQRWRIARPVVQRPREFADRLLCFIME
jgi:hypothetical protein